jgi:transcriptional regulator with XRE-family HTH domain
MMSMAPQVSFGEELRRRRGIRGLSLPELARRVHYSTGYLSKIENGHKRPTVELARQCDAVLRATGELAGLARTGRPAAERAAPAAPSNPACGPTPGEEVWTLSLADDGSGGFVPSRLDGLAAAEAPLAGSEFPTRGAEAAARSDQALGFFRGQFDQFRRLGHATSPFIVLPPLLVQTQLLRAIANGATDEEPRGALLRLAARYAEYAGWMAQESGDDRAASWWTATAVRLAEAGGDRCLAHYALVRRADIALYRQDATDTIHLTRRAQSDGTAPARVRGLAAQREAQGHALAGDYDSCLQALDRADALLRAAAEEEQPGPVLGSTNMPNPVAIAMGWCLQEVGRSADAARLLDEQVATMPSTARRARALWGARRALAHACAGEVAHACRLADGVVDDAELVDSATVRSELRELGRTLRRWRTHPAVRDIMPRVTTALHAQAG